MSSRALPKRLLTLAGGLAVAAGTLILMIATEPKLAIVWDEGYTLGREERVRAWFEALRDPQHFAQTWHPRPPKDELVEDHKLPPTRGEIDSRSKLLDPAVIAWFWPFGREEPHGHPPFYAIVGMVGDVIVPSWEILPRARFGPMLAFSLTSGAIFTFFATRWGSLSGLLAAGAWILQPRLFAHGHYASYDALLTCLWVASILAFAKSVEPGEKPRLKYPRWGWAVLFGILVGWALDTKLTGWFLPLPFIGWTAAYRDRKGAITLALGGLVALCTLYAFNPVWWAAPIAGLEQFFRSNLTRASTVPIQIQFLGRLVLTPRESLPWYNTALWTLFVTPIGFLFLALWGAVRSIARARIEPFGALVLAQWLLLLVLRSLPHMPGHDGERQILPAFGCLALLAGLGAAGAIERLGRWGRAIVVAAIAEGAISVAIMMPVPLSYYSPIVGGLPGATMLGMEPTYYWDGLTGEALDWLNEHTGPRQKVRFANYPSSWLYLQSVGRLKPDIRPTDPGKWTWYVLQNRPGAFSRLDLTLSERGKPSFVYEKLGVPLLWIFPYSEVQAIEPPPRPEGSTP